MFQIARQLLDKAFGHPISKPTTDRDATTQFLSNAHSQQHSQVRQSFEYWVKETGGLASGVAEIEGGAA